MIVLKVITDGVWMSLFLSTFCNGIDKKGRVSVPASFRSALMTQSFPGIVAFRSLEHPCIEAFGINVIEKISQSMNGLDPIKDYSQEWAYVICAETQQLPFDSEGRVLLPDIFYQHAQLEDAVTFVGRGPTLQLWNPNIFSTQQEEMRLRFFEQRSLSKIQTVAEISPLSRQGGI